MELAMNIRNPFSKCLVIRSHFEEDASLLRTEFTDLSKFAWVSKYYDQTSKIVL
jgi:hypothetical protein